MQVGGLEPIVAGAALAASSLLSLGSFTDLKRQKDLANTEELAAQCSRALRNLSVNRKLPHYVEELR